MNPANAIAIRKLALLAAFVLCAAASIADAGGFPSRGDRRADLTNELLRADRAATARQIEEISKKPASAARDEDLRLAVEFWAMHEPQAALQYAESQPLALPKKHALLEAVARGWTRTLPQEAWDWAVRHPIRDHLDLPRQVLETSAEVAPDRGLAWLRSEATARAPRTVYDYNEHAFAFFYRLADIGDYATARRLLDEFPAGELREQLLYFCTSRMARFALDETAAWSLSRREQPDAFFAQAAVAIRQCQRDPDNAFAWVLANPDDVVRTRLVGSVAGSWIEREPRLEVAKRILAKLERPAERQAALSTFAQTSDLVQAAPVPVMDWAWEIETLNDRRASLIRGYGAWHEIDAAAARAHLAQAGKARPDEQRIVAQFLTNEEP